MVSGGGESALPRLLRAMQGREAEAEALIEDAGRQ